MKKVYQIWLTPLKLLLFWLLLFDFQRILFSIHHWESFGNVDWSDWLMTFVYSFRLDLATASFLSVLPLFVFLVYFIYSRPWSFQLFKIILLVEAAVVVCIHAGEVNAYTEWGHKLTTRVFIHLSNPDEVFRTADYSMTIWFTIYAVLEAVFSWRLFGWLFQGSEVQRLPVWSWWKKAMVGIPVYVFLVAGLFVLARGGLQQIPINIDSAYFSHSHVVNDLSVNSTYFFGNSYVVHVKGDIESTMPKISPEDAQAIVDEMFDYPRKHDVRMLKNSRPNIVMIIMESWGAEGIGALSETKGATPNFDRLASEGILFTNFYASGSTSEIGNSSIFSGNPAIPEISISTQPEKHRKLHSLNEDLQEWGYSTHYIFSGDLKYGNIGGYFMDHGFQDVKDEHDFPDDLPRGKLNYFDEDLYDILLERINASEGKFLHCAFTGSTHSPFDHPKRENQNWTGAESTFMNSLIYADESLGKFIEKCKEQPWFENTLFVFIADHSHHTPAMQDMCDNQFYRIPLLFWGPVLKDDVKGQHIDKIGSQSDFAATLLNQMDGDPARYPWSKDLLNPECPEFVLHTIIRGYGWITDKGEFTYHLDHKKFFKNTFAREVFPIELKKGHAYLRSVYEAYKAL